MSAAEGLLALTKIPKQAHDKIDPAIWGKADPTADNVNEIIATTYMAYTIVNYIDGGLTDGELMGIYCEDYQGWTEDMFKKVDGAYLRELKRALRYKGVATGRPNAQIIPMLLNLLELEDPPEWEEKHLLAAIFDPESYAYRLQQEIKRQPHQQTSQPHQQTSQPHQQASQMVDTAEYTSSQQDNSPITSREDPQRMQEQRLSTERAVREGTIATERSFVEQRDKYGRLSATPYPERMKEGPPHTRPEMAPSRDQQDPYAAIPPLGYHPRKLDPGTMNTFVKTWNKDDNYTGKPYDLLADKVDTFYSICYHADIQPEHFHAVFPRILTGPAAQYYLHYINKRLDTFRTVYLKMSQHFDTDMNHGQYYTDWTTTSFERIRRENPDKTMHEALEMLIDKLSLCQRALGEEYRGEYALRTAVLTACRGVKELQMALFMPPMACEDLFQSLRSSIETSLAMPAEQFYTADEENYAFYTDRRYTDNRRLRGNHNSRGSGGYNSRGGNSNDGYNNFRGNTGRGGFGRGGFRGGFRSQPSPPQGNGNDRGDKKCFICGKTGCWSTNHSLEERKQSKSQYIAQCDYWGEQPNYTAFLVDYEGEELDQFLQEYEYKDEDEQAVAHLTDNSFLHHITGDDIYGIETAEPATQFLIEDRYNRGKFQGIMPDTGASKVSTGGREQFLALQSEDPTVTLDTSTAGKASVVFGKGNASWSVGTACVQTALGVIDFEILDAPTPFLLCLTDMDKLGVKFDNLTNTLIQGKNTIPVVRKWGHPWFHLRREEHNKVFLTEVELRRLHKRFGHPAAERLQNLLHRSGHDVDTRVLQDIKKFCHQCQVHDPAPRRFKFTLKDDRNFNYEIFVDVMYLDGKPVLHVVDSATAFNGARFLKSLSTTDTWEALETLWINTYQGPPDIITHDAGTNFASTEFKSEAKIKGITCKQVPVEAHWSIGKVERYHAPLRRAYEILRAELTSEVSDDTVLQMAVKAVNDTAGPDGLVPTLLVFGAYPRITIDSPPSPSMIRRAEAIQKAMKTLRKHAAERAVTDALNTRNGPSTEDVTALPLQSEVMVWREKKGWQGPYKVINTKDQDVMVDMINGPVTFRSTVVKPYYRDDNTKDSAADPNATVDPNVTTGPPQAPQPRKRGRPVGSKNKPKSRAQYLVQYMTKKEEDDYALAVKLRSDGVINEPGAPFEVSDQKEVNDLVGRGVFSFELFNPNEHGGYRIFKSRLVREVKGKTMIPYEKSRLVIQGYNDVGKTEILTQSPTIQRCSQRLMIALAPSLMKMGMRVLLRDITQAYPQSQTDLARTILADLPRETRTKYPEGTIIRVIRPLYGIAEAGVHWFATYQGHHCNKLNMVTSTYDPCLLVTDGRRETFAIVALQTDDTLAVCTDRFATAEDTALTEAKFRAKPKTALAEGKPLEFNGNTVTMMEDTIMLTQKGQGRKIEAIDLAAADRAQKYMEQRARGAYIASICQPEASFDLSAAAQVQQPMDTDYERLNKRLQWHADHMDRGIRMVPMDLSTAKLMVFTDGSFANNKDLSSQLGYLIVLVNESNGPEGTFTVRGNIIHWSSTKCKRITRSVLASELYGMVGGVDLAIAISTTLRMITERLELPTMPLIVCTDSYSLYECLVKLGTTVEKRLMVDVLALRQSYERREITEIRWISGNDNPADAFTKASPNRALERLIDSNELTIRMEGSVQRTGTGVQQ